MIEIRKLTIEARVPGTSTELDSRHGVSNPEQFISSIPDETINHLVLEILKRLRAQKEDR